MVVKYMSIGITHFVELTTLMYGSEDVMIAKTEGQRMTLQLGPACCCCVCLPSPLATR
ncbi:hypothetical protein SK128_000940 [Halocaridina rubra]|uniref:Uncharacterized protein n=1 Tax=Halocaridina rubra TaxID=373956 RepID=A0AAN8X2G1_HALRR